MFQKTLSGSIPEVPLSVGFGPVRTKNNEKAHREYDGLDWINLLNVWIFSLWRAFWREFLYEDSEMEFYFPSSS